MSNSSDAATDSLDAAAIKDSDRTSICDGSAQMRLRVFLEPKSDRELRGSIVRVENGYPSLAIDGSCSYWMGSWNSDDPTARDQGWRMGTINPDFNDLLDRTFTLSKLDQLGDCQVSAGSFDVSVRTVRSADSVTRCSGEGASFNTAWQTVASQAEALWAAANPISGAGIRVSAVESPDQAPGNKAPYPWPISEPLSSFLIQDPLDEGNSSLFSSGVSKLVPPPAADQLRALREQYIADRKLAPGLFGDGLEVSDGTLHAVIYLRDAIPYEDERGLLPFSEQP